MTSVYDTWTERQFQARVIQVAQVQHWRCYHTYNSRRSNPGFPDICMVRRGRLIFMELKREDRTKAKQTLEQGFWLIDLGHVPGVEAYLFRPSDMPHIKELLE